MENPIAVSLLNDFIFCPASIYFHSVDAGLDKLSYASVEQEEGSSIHEAVDTARYSDQPHILQGVSVYCEKYDLEGKIDLFDTQTGVLTERKRKIERIYDGYVFQLYAYSFALAEMGYEVKKLRFYSFLDNKAYEVPLPKDDPKMLQKFEETVLAIHNFDLSDFRQTNALKCKKCVYEPLCSFSIRENIC